MGRRNPTHIGRTQAKVGRSAPILVEFAQTRDIFGRIRVEFGRIKFDRFRDKCGRILPIFGLSLVELWPSSDDSKPMLVEIAVRLIECWANFGRFFQAECGRHWPNSAESEPNWPIFENLVGSRSGTIAYRGSRADTCARGPKRGARKHGLRDRTWAKIEGGAAQDCEIWTRRLTKRRFHRFSFNSVGPNPATLFGDTQLRTSGQCFVRPPYREAPDGLPPAPNGLYGLPGRPNNVAKKGAFGPTPVERRQNLAEIAQVWPIPE